MFVPSANEVVGGEPRWVVGELGDGLTQASISFVALPLPMNTSKSPSLMNERYSSTFFGSVANNDERIVRRFEISE